jgi:hypothetical protein
MNQKDEDVRGEEDSHRKDELVFKPNVPFQAVIACKYRIVGCVEIKGRLAVAALVITIPYKVRVQTSYMRPSIDRAYAANSI